jgi:nucleoid-associated protein YgaU
MFLTTTIWLYQTRNAGTDALTGQSKTVQSKLNALTTYLQQSRDSLALVLQNRPRQEDAERPGFEYLVKRGDSLSKIAYSILGDASRYDEIMRRNGLTETSLIYPGTKLQIEP